MALYDVSTTEKKTSPELVAGGTLYADSPIGTILPYGGATAPSGWFLCDGTAISRTTYSELFAVIGTAFGSGDGSTTFNVPDLRGKVPVGFNTSETEFNALGNTGGEKTHILTVSEMPSHSHKVSDSDSKKGIYDNFVDSSSGTYNRTTFQSCSAVSDPIDTTSTGGGTAHNNLQPYNTVNYIIKAKMTAVPADFMSVVDEAVEDVYGDIIPSDASASNKLVTESDLVSVTGTYPGILLPSQTITITLESAFGGFYGIIQVQNSGCIDFTVKNASVSSSSRVEIQEAITIDGNTYYAGTLHNIFGSNYYDLKDKIRFQCTADRVITIQNNGTESEAFWLGGTIKSITIS